MDNFPDTSKLENFAFYSEITSRAFRVAQQDTNRQIAILLEKGVGVPDKIEVVVELRFKQ